MARRRFFAEQIEDRVAILRGAQAAHVATVLRARPGQQYEIACDGRVYLGTISAVGPDRVSFAVGDALDEARGLDSGLTITLGAAVFKFDRMEWMLEKATELGAHRIALLQTRRTEPGLLAAVPRKLERWRRILLESAQQTRRADTPELLAPQSLASFLGSAGGERIMLVEEAGPAALREVFTAAPQLTLLTGPVGGWASEERQQAVAAGFVEASLGPRVLRCETAILAALAQLC